MFKFQSKRVIPTIRSVRMTFGFFTCLMFLILVKLFVQTIIIEPFRFSNKTIFLTVNLGFKNTKVE